MKIITALLISILLSCGQNSSKSKSYESDKKDSFVSESLDTSTTDRWHFEKYLTDAKTSQLAKDIFNNTWELKDDEPLEFLENLHGPDKEARPFYFRVITNSYKQSDGAYSEGLGHAAYKYVRNYSSEFSNYFVGQNAFTDADLKTWADIVMLEFELIGENEYDKALVKNYLDMVAKNCKNCTLQQKKVLDNFSQYLNRSWAEFLKHVEK